MGNCLRFGVKWMHSVPLACFWQGLVSSAKVVFSIVSFYGRHVGHLRLQRISRSEIPNKKGFVNGKWLTHQALLYRRCCRAKIFPWTQCFFGTVHMEWFTSHPWFCSKHYFGQTGRCLVVRLEKHQKNLLKAMDDLSMDDVCKLLPRPVSNLTRNSYKMGLCSKQLLWFWLPRGICNHMQVK